MGLPLVPAATDEDLLWTRDGLCLEAEALQLSLES